MQLQATYAGGSLVRAARVPKTGFGPVSVVREEGLLAELPREIDVYKHHTWEVADLPAGFEVLAESDECAVEAVAAPERKWWGTQFHPEQFDPEHPAGERVLRNFFTLAGLAGDG